MVEALVISFTVLGSAVILCMAIDKLSDQFSRIAIVLERLGRRLDP